jgi:kinetochore protein NDC80
VHPTVRDREEKREQQAQTERTIRGQKLTPLEIQNLSTERSALSRQMQDIQQRYRTAVSRTMNLEIDLNKRIDEATALAARYEEKAQPLGLLNGPLDGYEEVPFAQEINGASDNPVPEGLGTVVKPALSKLRQKTRDEIRDVNMTDFRIESELTKLKEILADLREKETVQVQELDVVDHEKGQMQEVRASSPSFFSGGCAYSSCKMMPQAMDRELATTGAELERLQNQVLAVQATMNDALAAANHRYEQRVVECAFLSNSLRRGGDDKLIAAVPVLRRRMAAYEQTSALRRKNRDALEQAIEQFMGYKEHMTDGTDRLATLLDEVAATV